MRGKKEKPDEKRCRVSLSFDSFRGGERLLCVRGGWLAFRQMDRLRRQLEVVLVQRVAPSMLVRYRIYP